MERQNPKLPILRGTLALIVAALLPACGNSSPAPAGTAAPATSVLLATQSVDASGGTVAITNPGSPAFGTQVIIPAGALAAPTTITIAQVISSTLGPSVMEFDFGPSGTVFATPVTVTVRYSPQYLASLSLSDPTLLRVIDRASTSATEELVTASQDLGRNLITVETTHFTTFAAVGFSNATLSGSYFFEGYWFNGGPQPNAPATGNPLPGPTGFTVDAGILTFDGVGGWTYTDESMNRDSVVSAPGGGTGSYSVAPDGTLTFLFGYSATGGVLADGSAFVLSTSSRSGGPPEINIGIRKGGSFTNASLSGTYFFQGYWWNGGTQPNAPATGTPLPAPTGFSIDAGILTFDGAGNWTYSAQSMNQDATISAPGNIAGSYSVAPDGTLTFLSGYLATGGILAGGNTFLVNTASKSGSDPEINIGIKKSGAFTNASLAGSYFLERYWFNGGTQPNTPAAGNPLPAPTGFTADAGILTFDGNGSWTYTSESLNRDGVITAPGGATGTYAVAADGTVTFTAGFLAAGGLLAGGSVLMLNTSGQSGSPPEFNVAVRSVRSRVYSTLVAGAATGAGDTAAYYLQDGALFWARNILAPVQIDSGVTEVAGTLVGGSAPDSSDTVVYYLKGTTLFWARHSLAPVQVDTQVSFVVQALVGPAAIDGSDTVIYYLKGSTFFLARNSLAPFRIDTGVAGVAGTLIGGAAGDGSDTVAYYIGSTGSLMWARNSQTPVEVGIGVTAVAGTFVGGRAPDGSDTVAYFLRDGALFMARNSQAPVALDTQVTSVSGILGGGAAADGSDPAVYYLKESTLFLARNHLTPVQIDSGITYVMALLAGPAATGSADTVAYYEKGTTLFLARNTTPPLLIDSGVTALSAPLIGGAATDGSDTAAYYLKAGSLFWARNTLAPVLIDAGVTSLGSTGVGGMATGCGDTVAYYQKGGSLEWARNTLAPVAVDTGVTSLFATLVARAAIDGSDSVAYYFKGTTLFLARNSLAPVQVATGVATVFGPLAGGRAANGTDTAIYYISGGRLFWARNILAAALIAGGI